ncbi:toxin-antitoxin system YwqK family antitoxin [Autumnicola psychrophila]|uniref:Aspartic peptidase n=1 Tax=Autumnicola psychrophila TaxID=3075592 RepID=A0ABU3DR23_9FLAO|nr:aspartic peptidase [Zunongwangia sp. F225]MDT0686170.1 aspartic peptidase [Zunongwangia sp. F225]
MYQQLCILLFLLIGMQLFSQEEINQLDSEGRRHGKWTVNFKGTSQLKFEGIFEHGKETGEFRFYKRGFDNHPSAILHFKEQIDSVTATYYTQKGEPISTGRLIDQKREGKWIYYHQASRDTMMIENYQSDQLNGLQKTFFKNGKLAEKSKYKNGKKNGQSFVYSEEGVLLQELNYENGELHGPVTYYNAEGDTLIEGQYIRDQKKGNWKYFQNKKLTEEKEL